MYIEYFCASLMITINDIDVILRIPMSPVYINAFFLFNGKSLPTYENHTIHKNDISFGHVFYLRPLNHKQLLNAMDKNCQT